LTELTKEESYQREIERLDNVARHIAGTLIQSGVILEEINYIGAALCSQYMAQIIRSMGEAESDEYPEELARKSSDLHDALALRATEMGFTNAEFDYFITNSNLMNATITVKTIMTDKRVFQDLGAVNHYWAGLLTHNPFMKYLFDLKEEMLQGK